MLEKLFFFFFVSDVSVLVNAAVEVGLDKGDVEKLLHSNEFRDTVNSKDSSAKQQLRVSGVPYFIIASNDPKQRPTAFSGAQVNLFYV